MFEKGGLKMNELKLGVVDSRFADIVWKNAPLSTAELVKKCGEELSWKRTTTYSVLKKFCDNNIFKLENSVVSVLVTKEELHSRQSEKFVEEVFDGSLPAFIAAFTSKKRLTKEEVASIQRMIDSAKEEK